MRMLSRNEQSALLVSFNEFNPKYSFLKKAISNIENQQIPSNKVKFFLRDGPFISDVGIVNLHPSKGTHWVLYINKIFLIHRVVHYQTNCLSLMLNEMHFGCILSTNSKALDQKEMLFVLLIVHVYFFTTTLGMLKKSAVLYLYCQTVSWQINDVTEKNIW